MKTASTITFPIKIMHSKIILLILGVSICSTSFGQYYLRGQLKDEQGNGLNDVRIALFSKGNYPFFTGTNGVFGLPSSLKVDTITFMKEGYDTLRVPVVTSQYGNFALKLGKKRSDNLPHLSSYTKGFPYSSIDRYDETDKNRSAYIENATINTNTYPETILGLHVNKAGYSKIRQLISNKEKPLADEVKIEELLNYFNLKLSNPESANKESISQKPFYFESKITGCPWNEQSRLLFINLTANKINLNQTPPANIVFLIDASGSMDAINKLPVLKSAFKLLTAHLRPTDKVSIVTYGDVVTELLPSTNGSEKQRIIEAIEGLRPNGNTPGASAIQMAYAKARENFIPQGNNRIILATDGDFNVGATDAKGLVELAKRESRNGIYLSCLGVGMNKDENLEALAKAGQGHSGYLDNERDAEKILVEEFAQTLYSVAGNVFLNVHFNSNEVKEYRLIGFDNKRNTLNSNITDLLGGEAGSGQSMMAAFEITPSGNRNESIATAELSYQLPNKSENSIEKYEVLQNYESIEKINSEVRFAAAVVAFGEMLKQSEYYKDYTWSELENLVSKSVGNNNLIQKELIDLVIKARKIYPSRRNKIARTQ